MPLIPQNHLEFIIEVAVVLQVAMMFILSLIPISLSLVLMGSLVVGTGFALLFGMDALVIFLPGLSHSEFTHPFGPLALLVVVTALSALPMLKEAGVNTKSLRNYVYIIIIAITVFGGLMHRSFLLLWFLGLFIGFFVISKSFRQKSVFTIKRIALVILAVLVGFGILELLSKLLNMTIFSPTLRLTRIEQFSLPSLKMVIQNTNFLGHNLGSCYWGETCQGGSDGYMSLPISLIMLFGLPYPLFFGILVSKKDVIDYMLPGIFGVSFDFGYIFLFLMFIWFLGIIGLGFLMLRKYRKKRENGNKAFLGREALLIGSITAFIAQGLVGLFLLNRSINGLALLTFLFLSALVLGHVVFIKDK
jgi:hypothetical protein